MFRLLILCFIFTANATIINSSFPKVQISSGEIEGQYVYSKGTNKSFYSFRGIPYAEPPIEKLRFQPPVKVKSWTKTLETKTDGAQCVQKGGGSEDCLFLNVYTPKLPSNGAKEKLLPVMVFVHGGAFLMGSSASYIYGPDYLIDHDVVLVTFNYRLNIFGFLNAMEESAPGNAGLKDQVFALEWVKENIKKFNGDPNKVTIFGQSAGSASVAYLVQTKLANGLFHGAIMESACTLNNWSFEFDPVDAIKILGKVLHIASKNITDLVNELQILPSDKLFTAYLDETLLGSKHKIFRDRFIPSLEYDSSKAFMTENSYSLLKENKINHVPLMFGYNSNEALAFIFMEGTDFITLLWDEYENDPTLMVPVSMNINNDTDRLKIKMVWKEIEKQYFNGVSVTDKAAFANFKSDEMFVRGIRKSIEFLRNDNDIYHYIFDYKKEYPDYPGVHHGAELLYLFYMSDEISAEDKINKDKMTTLWTNFAKTGNPTPNADSVLDNIKWPKVSKSEEQSLEYLYINTKLEIKENPWKENYEFWNKLFDKYGKTPFFLY